MQYSRMQAIQFLLLFQLSFELLSGPLVICSYRCCLSLPAMARNSSVAAFSTDTKVSSTGVANVPGIFALVGAPAIAGVNAFADALLLL
jgi:hypothetical protein